MSVLASYVTGFETAVTTMVIDTAHPFEGIENRRS